MKRMIIVYDVPDYEYEEDVLENPEDITSFAHNVYVVHNLHGKVKSVTVKKNLKAVHTVKLYKDKVMVPVKPTDARNSD